MVHRVALFKTQLKGLMNDSVLPILRLMEVHSVLKTDLMTCVPFMMGNSRLLNVAQSEMVLMLLLSDTNCMPRLPHVTFDTSARNLVDPWSPYAKRVFKEFMRSLIFLWCLVSFNILAL